MLFTILPKPITGKNANPKMLQTNQIAVFFDINISGKDQLIFQVFLCMELVIK